MGKTKTQTPSEPIQPMNLYRIDEDLSGLETAMLAAGGEIDEETEQRYTDLLKMHEEKLGGYYCVIRRLELSATAAKIERDRFARMVRSMENAAANLKRRVLESLIKRGATEAVTPAGRFAVQGNGGIAPTVVRPEYRDLTGVPERFIRTVTTRSIDLVALREALDAGDEEAQRIAYVGERGVQLRMY